MDVLGINFACWEISSLYAKTNFCARKLKGSFTRFNVRANCFWALKFTPRHRWARALSIKMNNDRDDGRGVLLEKLCGECGPLPKTFTLFMTKICEFCRLFFPDWNRFYSHCPKMKKKIICGKLKKIHDFCPRDIESCHLAAARCVKYELVL